MSDPQPSPTTAPAFWWFAWIFSTTILPAGLGIGITTKLIPPSPLWNLAGLGIFVLHWVSSSKISKQRPGLGPLLWLGGWALMYVTSFVTCGMYLRN